MQGPPGVVPPRRFPNSQHSLFGQAGDVLTKHTHTHTSPSIFVRTLGDMRHSPTSNMSPRPPSCYSNADSGSRYLVHSPILTSVVHLCHDASMSVLDRSRLTQNKSSCQESTYLPLPLLPPPFQPYPVHSCTAMMQQRCMH